jgi:phosphoribosyl 1,2-cyclic phosphodiesterase
MSLRFTVLGSGSSGNASLLQWNRFGVLIDAGLGPRVLAARLHEAGSSWQHVHAVILTHIHGDHWRESGFTWLLRRRIVFYCHSDHAAFLASCSRSFCKLEEAGLVQQFEGGEEVRLGESLRCRPLSLRHDSGATFGFRFEGPTDIFGQAETLGYAADLGTWGHDLVHDLANADVLALEFNHDPYLQRASGRSPALIARVLSDEGHLSNAQAAGLLSEVLARSERGRLRHLVQLHLSRDCNDRDLAHAAARTVLAEWDEGTVIHTARHDRPLPTLYAGWQPNRPRRSRRRRRFIQTQPLLPGCEFLHKSVTPPPADPPATPASVLSKWRESSV